MGRVVCVALTKKSVQRTVYEHTDLHDESDAITRVWAMISAFQSHKYDQEQRPLHRSSGEEEVCEFRQVADSRHGSRRVARHVRDVVCSRPFVRYEARVSRRRRRRR